MHYSSYCDVQIKHVYGVVIQKASQNKSFAIQKASQKQFVIINVMG